MDYTIRPLKKDDDMNQLYSLSKEFFTEYQDNHEFFFNVRHIDYEHILGYFESWLDRDDKKAFVAMDKDKIIGYITVYIREQPEFWVLRKVGAISGLMVDSNYRKQGIATALLKHGLDFLRDNGVDHFTVFTSSNNARGLSFYKKMGMSDLYSHLLGSVSMTLDKIGDADV